MEAYRIVNRGDSRSLAEYLTEDEQILLPMVELIEGSRMAIDELTAQGKELGGQIETISVNRTNKRRRSSRARQTRVTMKPSPFSFLRVISNTP